MAKRSLTAPLRHWRSTLACALTLLSVPLDAAPSIAQSKTTKAPVVYAGRLEDLSGRPLGGVYPLTFNFYRTETAKSATWSETHYVAVDNGIYALELGRLKTLPKNTDLTKLWLGVSVGSREILRERFNSKAPTSSPFPAVSPTAGAPVQNAQGTYADLAGFALEAEKAKNADAIGGISAADIKVLVTKASTPAPAPAAAKPKIGNSPRFSEAIGGNGGDPFAISCPPGHVATGIKGRGAALIDQISLICSPLE